MSTEKAFTDSTVLPLLLEAPREDISEEAQPSVSDLLRAQRTIQRVKQPRMTEIDLRLYADIFSADRPVPAGTPAAIEAEEELPPISDLQSVLRFSAKPWAEVRDNSVLFFIDFHLDPSFLSRVRFFVRWGSYDDIAENWSDTPVCRHEIEENGFGGLRIAKSFCVERRGYYGATVYALAAGSEERVWQGNGAADDARFRIDVDSLSLVERISITQHHRQRVTERALFGPIGSVEQFESTLKKLASNDCRRYLSRILFEITKNNEELKALLAECYTRAAESSGSAKEETPSPSLTGILDSIGIGEVVLVSPEGPHARFGGLAQVIDGLINSFARHAIPVTLISLLYQNEQGSKHADWKTTLRNGILVNKQRLFPKYAGEIHIPFGPTHRSGSTQPLQQRHQVRAAVYVAETADIRIILLRHEWYSDYLYAKLLADDQLRRVIFLSRGALEVMKNPIFQVRPQLVLSNDWLTALVPVFLKLDQRYAEHDNLQDVKTIHLIHNCGRDYHGVIPTNFRGHDLFPMLEISSEHYGGLTDPKNWHAMNMTAAAINHLNGAVLAVSKPYAKQLLSGDGGEGLSHLLWRKRDALFGISNAVDQDSVRDTATLIGERALKRLGEAPGGTADEDGSPYIANLLRYKAATKRVLQENLGLHVNPNAIIISFVGRLVEQKGVQLLSGHAQGDGISCMEFILRRFPEVQFVIAGPTVDGDNCSQQFRNLVSHLSWAYRGRVVGMFDYVPHEFALEIFTASDFSLMPSRFEPGGLTQLESLCCGTLVIARDVGGLSATLKRFDDAAGKGDGFLFDDYSPTALRNTICWAIDRTRSDYFRHGLALEAAKAEHDWSDRMPEYCTLFQYIAGVLAKGNCYKHLDDRLSTIDFLRA